MGLLLYDMVIPILSTYPKDLETCPDRTMHVNLYSSVVHND